MARFSGAIGYNHGTAENPVGSGVWVENIVERTYFGNVLRNASKLAEGEYLNGTLSVSNSISVVADAYANENFADIRYVKWNGKPWVVTEVQVEAPRLLLRLGGLYNGNTA